MKEWINQLKNEWITKSMNTCPAIGKSDKTILNIYVFLT